MHTSTHIHTHKHDLESRERQDQKGVVIKAAAQNSDLKGSKDKQSTLDINLYNLTLLQIETL